ncbi:ABC transporter ATP-binding protein [Gulosibacter sediminis]|uniref:ABC transporter ATP-binding protein n=1 Tax=Gulosibacter sediminis TaxID=1729695 RepID=UPI0024ACDD06|nr:ABC transporter ATP-binding protein [Gulosibacter sediminis]
MSVVAPSRPESLLGARGVYAGYRGREVLRGIDLDVRAGEVLGLIGPNGAGKSTLLRVLGGLAAPGAGEVTTPVGTLARLAARDRARHVAFLPQDTRIDAELTVRAVVELGRYAHRRRLDRMRGELRAGDLAAVDDALARVGVRDFAERPITELSGGQRQLVLIGKQLAQQPRVLLLDEPVSALDLAYQLQVVDLLRDLARDGCAVVAVLHDLNLAARACDRLALLADGELRAEGPPERVLTPGTLEAAYGVHSAVDLDPRLEVPRVTVLSRASVPTGAG